MPLDFLNTLEIHFDLVKHADITCIPQAIDGLKNGYRLKSRINCCLGGETIKQVPTGVRVVDFPEFSVDSSTPGLGIINMFVEACCVSDEVLLNEYGIRTLGPNIINKYYNMDVNGEIVVTLQNTTKDLFYLDPGDDISIITFNIKPLVEFTINPIALVTPRT